MDAGSQDAVPSLGRCVQQSHSAEFLAKTSVETVLDQGESENGSTCRVPDSCLNMGVACEYLNNTASCCQKTHMTVGSSCNFLEQNLCRTFDLGAWKYHFQVFFTLINARFTILWWSL